MCLDEMLWCTSRLPGWGSLLVQEIFVNITHYKLMERFYERWIWLKYITLVKKFIADCNNTFRAWLNYILAMMSLSWHKITWIPSDDVHFFYFSGGFKAKNSTTNVIKQQTELSIIVFFCGWSLSGSASNIDLKVYWKFNSGMIVTVR